jgi:hypothetical protein
MTINQGIRRILFPLFLLTVLGVAITPLTTGAPSPSSGTTDFATYLEPRLAALVESSQKVETMVSGRSRNVVALRAESERIDALVSDIDAYLDAHDVPGWAEPVVSHYRDGAARIETSIEAAWEAMRTFDFSRMSEMILVFSQGTEDLETALRALKDATGDGSSYTDNGVA